MSVWISQCNVRSTCGDVAEDGERDEYDGETNILRQ